jgi:hypothetical protein
MAGLFGQPKKRKVPSYLLLRLKKVAADAFKLEWTLPTDTRIQKQILKLNNDIIRYEDGEIDDVLLIDNIRETEEIFGRYLRELR